jgi:D-alanine--poly(phosphoribitol) ligase subunit 1
MFKKFVLSPVLDSINKYSTHNAFLIRDNYYLYKDLAQSISKIRTSIQNLNFSGNIIGLVTHDDLETYASIFAIWLEGYSYAPLHPRHPHERNMKIVDQAEIDLIVDSSDTPLFKSVKTVQSKGIEFKELNLIPNEVPDDNLAYILFTSGSTGQPKGVPISRGNLGTFMKAFWEVGFEINEEDRCLQCFDLTFDVSVQSFMVPLARGACTYTIPHDQIKYSYAYGLLEQHKLTFGAMAPSMVNFLQPYFEEIDLPDLRYNILTAEASALGLVKEWSKCIPNAEIYDFYGPTEATVYCTYYKYNPRGPNKQYNGMLSIGKPLNGVIAIVTDDDNRVIENNNKGELCIAGGQITSGYWQNQEKNLISFVEIVLNGIKHRFYKTGDLCYIDSEGDIMYSGRLDYQVKIQGFRIEMGEIEHYARELANGLTTVAVAFKNDTGNDEIALFVKGELTDTDWLADQLKLKLPYYMMPSKIIVKDDFPLNSNGKIDRNILIKSLKQ